MALDMTNFATFIDSGNDRAPIAQRGHAKQKRADLRLVGLALVVTRDGGVPVVGHAYPGNRPDVTLFAAVVDELVARYRELAAGDEAADRGLRRRAELGVNFAHLVEVGLHFVGSLPPSEHPDLLAIPARRRQRGRRRALSRADRLRDPRPGARRYPARRAHPLPDPARQTVPRLRSDPRQGHAGLAELAARLARGRTRRDRAGSKPRSPAPCGPAGSPGPVRHLTGDAPPSCGCPGTPTATARRALETELFGKRILVTDRETGRSSSWSPATAPKPTPRAASASSKTPRGLASARCGTGPTRRSGCTSPTASSRSPSPT